MRKLCEFYKKTALASIRDKVVSANAYLGAKPITEALKLDADIVITGRVADASLTVAPAVHAFGWKWDAWDRLSAASVAGHIIECGAQATGGLYRHWESLDLAHVGYPIAELSPDRHFVISAAAHRAPDFIDAVAEHVAVRPRKIDVFEDAVLQRLRAERLD